MPLDNLPSGASGPHISFEQELAARYLAYAMSVNISRALPDVRDGLKPVQRRIMYAMLEGGYTFSKPPRKSARIVGDVMGTYHPHGDASIYDAMARMAQLFSLRVPLIDGQGNFGSVDGDPPAAMRYTEARLSRAAELLLSGVHPKVVDFRPNYDGSTEEPCALPARWPNLLINGASGIGVAMASNIPPHNPVEAINAAIAVIQDPSIDLDALMQIIKGPDFPTGATVMGRSALRAAYETGRGSVVLRGTAEVETVKVGKSGTPRRVIAITEIPFMVNKANLAARIKDLAEPTPQAGGKPAIPPVIPGIADVRDESDREGNRIAVELKKDADENAVLAAIYRHTELQTTFPFNMVAIDERTGSPQPVLFGLKGLLQGFTDHAYDVLRRESLKNLEEARGKLHLQVGLLAALDAIDLIISTIRANADSASAKAALMLLPLPYNGLLAEVGKLDPKTEPVEGIIHLTEAQAHAITEMRLGRLTGLEREKIADEAKSFAAEAAEMLRILNDRDHANSVLIGQMEAARDGLRADLKPRRTKIEDHGPDATDDLATIPREEVLVTITTSGYIKRVLSSAFRTQKRGGTGKAGARTGDEEAVALTLPATTHARLLVFTAKGMAYAIPVHRLPAAQARDKGRPIVNFCEPLKSEEITAVLVREPDADEGDNLLFVTSAGDVRRNAAADFARIASNGKIAMKFEEGNTTERLVAVLPVSDNDDVLLASSQGQAIRFAVEELRVFSSRGSTGVRGINLADGDRVIGATALPHGSASPDDRDAWLSEERRNTLSAERQQELAETERMILTVSEKGYGKRSSTHEFRVTGRGGKGVTGHALSDATGALVAALPVDENEDVMVTTRQGQVIRMKASDLAYQGRATRGTRLIRLDANDVVLSVMKLARQEEEQPGEAEPIAGEK